MTAEKGEHERAPPVWVSWPASLRATLRAPPAKWAVEAFFPAGERSEPRSRTAPKGLPQTEAHDAQRGGPPLESPCRVLSLVQSFASKESTTPFGAAAPPSVPWSARQAPLGQRECACGRTKGLSSGQTIGAVRTAVRSACCLPELRVANRLRRLYPLDDGELFKFNLKSSVCQRQTGLPKGNPPCVFPSFPPAPLRIATQSNRAPHGTASSTPAP